MTREQAEKLLQGIEDTREAALRNEKSTARYWNCDDWGSISGSRDAASWVKDQMVQYIMKEVK